MQSTRRNFLHAAPLTIAGMAVGNSTLVRAATRDVPFVRPSTAVMDGAGSAMKNLITKLKTTGASAADIREARVSLSTMFAEFRNSGLNDAANEAIRANRSKILSFDPATIDLEAHIEKIQSVVPGLEREDLQRVFQSVKPTTLSLAANSTMESLQQQILNGLHLMEHSGLVASNGADRFRTVQTFTPCQGVLIAAAGLGIISIFAPEADLVVFGIAISLGDALLIIAGGYALAAVSLC